jgi:5-methylcytosine-specific restriction endonuclease McrA
MKKVLLLNSSEEILRFIEWQRAVSLLCDGKAEAPYNYDHYYKIPHASGVFSLPKALRLKNYIRVPRIQVYLSRKNVHRRDEYVCQYCRTQLIPGEGTIDHVFPRSRGGVDTWENLVCSCMKCNVKKGNRTPREANMPLIRLPKEPKYLNNPELQLPSIWSRWA